ncbi:MAG: molybdopterin-binding protein [Aureliella sp.]
MEAEVISIGDELTSGQRLDTNSQWLSRELAELGVKVVQHSTVADDLARNVSALRAAANGADVVVITGGLGPTQDDLTRQAMAEAFNRELQLDQQSLRRIEAMFKTRKREMPERNRVQAMFPRGSSAIPNPHGTAPGVDLQMDEPECRLFALPGVPAEMKQMWRDTVAPNIDAMANKRLGGGSLPPLRFFALKAFGIGESDVEVRLPDLVSRSREPTVGITVSRATITLRIAGRAHTDEEFQRLIHPTVSEIQSALGDLVFGSGDDTLQSVVAAQLKETQMSCATIEVGGSSFLGDCFATVAEKDDTFFRGSMVFRDFESASRWLGVDENSDPRQLAAALRERAGADFGLAVCGYPTKAEMAVGNTTFDIQIALASRSAAELETKKLSGHPDVLPARIAKFGLDSLRRKLLASTE